MPNPLKETATELSEDAEWQSLILAPPDVLGVDALDHMGITLRLFLKTQPLKQWVVSRELRRRVKMAFDEAGIAIGVPHEQIALRWDAAGRQGLERMVDQSDTTNQV